MTRTNTAPRTNNTAPRTARRTMPAAAAPDAAPVANVDDAADAVRVATAAFIAAPFVDETPAPAAPAPAAPAVVPAAPARDANVNAPARATSAHGFAVLLAIARAHETHGGDRVAAARACIDAMPPTVRAGALARAVRSDSSPGVVAAVDAVRASLPADVANAAGVRRRGGGMTTTTHRSNLDPDGTRGIVALRFAVPDSVLAAIVRNTGAPVAPGETWTIALSDDGDGVVVTRTR